MAFENIKKAGISLGKLDEQGRLVNPALQEEEQDLNLRVPVPGEQEVVVPDRFATPEQLAKLSAQQTVQPTKAVSQPVSQPAVQPTAQLVQQPTQPKQPPASEQQMATVVNPQTGQRAAVPVGSEQAQAYFRSGFVLEKAPPEATQAPETAPAAEPAPTPAETGTAAPEPSFEDQISAVLERYGLTPPDATRDPVAQAVKTYKSVYQQLGLPTVKQQYDNIFNQYSNMSQQLADQIADVNENPWLTEGLRRSKINDLNKRFELKTAALTGQMALYQDILEQGQREAEFVADQIGRERLMDRDLRERLFEQAIASAFPEQETTEDITEFLFAKERGYEGDFLDFMDERKATGPDTQVITANGRRLLIDKDTGQVIQDFGSSEDVTEEDVKKILESNRIQRTIANVKDNIDQSLDLLNKAKGLGAAGRAVAQYLPGSDTRDLKATIQSIKGNLGFDRLQQMRDSSPTGGAVGQLSDRELTVLSSTIENLDITQSTDVLQANLKKVKEFYEAWERDLQATGQISTGVEGEFDLSTPDFDW